MKRANRILKLCISLVLWPWYGLWKSRRPATAVTIYYHGVGQEEISRFTRQMDMLKALAKPVSAKVAARSETGRRVALTFDDGFQSVAENAVPVLVERMIPFAVFVTAGYMGSPPGWAEDRGDPNGKESVMTEAQIKSLPSHLVTIGSHTLTHRDLHLLTDEEVRTELVGSKQKLESVTGQAVTLLTVPYGKYDSRVAGLAKEAGYECLFRGSTRSLKNENGEFIMERIRVSPSDWDLEFKLKLVGAYRWLPMAIAAKRKMRGLRSLEQ